MKNSADLGGCYPPRPLASVDNTLLDLQNSSYPTQPHSIIANYLNLDYLRMQLKWKFDYCFVFFPQKERCNSLTADAFLFDQETKFPYRYYKHTLPNNTSLYLGVNRDCNDDRLSLICSKIGGRLCKFEWVVWINYSIDRGKAHWINESQNK